MGILNSLGNFAWGCEIPCLMGDTKNIEGVPKSLGDLLGGAGSPMTPAVPLLPALFLTVDAENPDTH